MKKILFLFLITSYSTFAADCPEIDAGLAEAYKCKFDPSGKYGSCRVGSEIYEHYRKHYQTITASDLSCKKAWMHVVEKHTDYCFKQQGKAFTYGMEKIVEEHGNSWGEKLDDEFIDKYMKEKQDEFNKINCK